MTLTIDENETKEIEVWIKDETDIPVVKHEECHVRQINKNKFFSCDFPILKLITEIECYSVQRYWEVKIYLKEFLIR